MKFTLAGYILPIILSAKSHCSYANVYNGDSVSARGGEGLVTVKADHIAGRVDKPEYGDVESLLSSDTGTGDVGSVISRNNGVEGNDRGVVHDHGRGGVSDDGRGADTMKISSTVGRGGERGDPAIVRRMLTNSHNNPCFTNKADLKAAITSYIGEDCVTMNGGCTTGQTWGYPVKNWCVSQIMDMSLLFDGMTTFNEDISGWNVSSVTNMDNTFRSAEMFNQDLSGWDVSSVMSMDRTFERAFAFNGNIANWDTSSVRNMNKMFNEAIVFNQDLSGWDTSSVKNMRGMFGAAQAFDQDIENWDVSKVETMSKMFSGASSFNQDLANWDTCSVTDKWEMFGDVWQIFFAGLDTNFTSTSETELSLKFDIGKNPPSGNSTNGRYKTKLYKQDCTTEISTSGAGLLLFSLTDGGRITKKPTNSTFDAIDLKYNVNKTMIASSSVWNSTTKEINICQEVQLVEKHATLGELVIVEDKRVVTIEFDLSAIFRLDADLQEGALTSASDAIGVDDYVTAYKCDENFVANASPLVPNGELFVCIDSSSTNVEIKEIEIMTIKQEGVADLPVVVNSVALIPAITEEIFVSTTRRVISTRVPSNIFTFAANEVIEVDGKAIMNLVGSSSRKLQADNEIVETGAAASFGIKVALQAEVSPQADFAWNSATFLASKNFATLGMVLAFVL